MSGTDSGAYCGHAFISTMFAAVYVGLHSLAQVIQQKGALESHFHDGSIQSHSLDLRLIVRRLDLVQPTLKLDAFAVVGLFDARRQRRVLDRRLCKSHTSANVSFQVPDYSLPPRGMPVSGSYGP